MKDSTGQKFGMLTAIRRRPGFKRRSDGAPITYYECLCECGKKKMICGTSLAAGITKSCGCRQGKHEHLVGRLGYGESALNSKLKDYIAQAERRGLPFELSRRHAKRIMSDFCFYCGSPPLALTKKAGGYGEFAYNGIDRLNNEKGYIKGNVVPCCADCNWVKGRCSFGRFVAWVERAANHLRENQPKWPSVLRDQVERARSSPFDVGIHPRGGRSRS